MTERRNRGSAGARPALVIEGEAVVIARHARAKPFGDAPWADDLPPVETPAAATAGYARPPTMRRRPATPDLVFQSRPRQRFAGPVEPRPSVLPRSVWIAGLTTLAVLLPLAAISVYGSAGPAARTVVSVAPAAATVPSKPVRILYGTTDVPPTRIALGGETRPARLPGALGGVYPIAAGPHPAGVARLGSVRNVPDTKAAARRIPTP